MMNADNEAVILTIDDEIIIRESFRYLLEDYHYKVLDAPEGKTGLAIFRREKPDLVLVDLRMAEMDGLDVLAEIKATSPETPVIIVSGTGVIADVVEALRLGAWDYLLKPIEDMSVLIHAVEKSLERARLISENQKYQEHLEVLVTSRTQQLDTANRDLKAVNIRLGKSEEKYRLLFETMVHGFAICEPVHPGSEIGDYWFCEVNPAFELLTGIPADKAGRMTVSEVFPGAGEKWFSPKGEKAMAAEPARFEYHAKGIGKYFDILAYRLRPDQMVLVIGDITDRKALEMQLIQAQKMEAIGSLAGGVAHDFNNILGAIMGYAELALFEVGRQGAAKKKLQQMLSSCHRAKDLVNQILSFSRQSTPEKRPVKAHFVIKEAMKLLRAALPTTIDIQFNVETESATIMADPTQLHQIVMNLCTNAHHAMGEKGGVLSVDLVPVIIEDDITVSAVHLPPGDYLKLTVADTGEGIDPVVVEKIFDPYFTTKKKGEGTGLGLAVVRGIVEKHGGAVKVETNPGTGTVFDVYFPMAPTQMEEEKEEFSLLQYGTERLLFVDDEEILVEIGKDLLERLGYTVTVSISAEKAFAIFRADPDGFDLVITDMTMPGMTGDVLAGKMQDIRPGLPVIVCTGYSESLDGRNPKDFGFKGVIMKPLAIEKLAAAIRKALD